MAARRGTRVRGLEPSAGAATVRRCFSFLDLCGFSDFVDAEGAVSASEVLTAVRSSIRVVTSAYGIRVAKWLGDGALVLGADPKVVLAATLEIRADAAERQVPLPLRGGAAFGKALVFEGDDYIGRPINVAAKLCAIAERDRVLIPFELAESNDDVVTIRSTLTRQVPGSAAPMRLATIELKGGDAGEVADPGTFHGSWVRPAS